MEPFSCCVNRQLSSLLQWSVCITWYWVLQRHSCGGWDSFKAAHIWLSLALVVSLGKCWQIWARKVMHVDCPTPSALPRSQCWWGPRDVDRRTQMHADIDDPLMEWSTTLEINSMLVKLVSLTVRCNCKAHFTFSTWALPVLKAFFVEGSLLVFGGRFCIFSINNKTLWTKGH